VGLRNSREPDDRDLAIGRHLVLAEVRGLGHDATPGGRTLVAGQDLRTDVDALAADLDPDPIGVLRDVVEPGRVAGGPAGDYDNPGNLSWQSGGSPKTRTNTPDVGADEAQ
jgi:hypothetical protein